MNLDSSTLSRLRQLVESGHIPPDHQQFLGELYDTLDGLLGDGARQIVKGWVVRAEEDRNGKPLDKPTFHPSKNFKFYAAVGHAKTAVPGKWYGDFKVTNAVCVVLDPI